MPFKDQPVTDMQGRKRGGRCASIAEHSPVSQQILLVKLLRGSKTQNAEVERKKKHTAAIEEEAETETHASARQSQVSIHAAAGGEATHTLVVILRPTAAMPLTIKRHVRAR